ncbi:MAG TPA: TMEM165/GDT1 family protein [Symbiobacteriaceae bacterium]|jgi:putative Ca2+/H+ antiporter (TMEM165/GDT1 family)
MQHRTWEESKLHALSTSFLMVVLGEMGDKTQLLAMAFVGRFRAWQVMTGVVLATLLNHALAVAVGTYMAGFIPMSAVSIVAGMSFLLFGLWTLAGDTLGDEAQRRNKFGPLLTVAIAFFLAEMGDKTQLATVALAAEFRDPIPVLTGTTLGMVVADGLGVWVGDFVNRKLSPQLMKYLSAAIFVAFGFITLYRAMASSTLSYLVLAGLAMATAGATYWLVRKPQREADAGKHEAA